MVRNVTLRALHFRPAKTRKSPDQNRLWTVHPPPAVGPQSDQTRTSVGPESDKKGAFLKYVAAGLVFFRIFAL